MYICRTQHPFSCHTVRFFFRRHLASHSSTAERCHPPIDRAQDPPGCWHEHESDEGGIDAHCRHHAEADFFHLKAAAKEKAGERHNHEELNPLQP